MTTESYSPFKILMQYYGNSSSPGAHIPFNFGLLTSSKKKMVESIDESISIWLNGMPENTVPNWVVCDAQYNTFFNNIYYKIIIPY